MSMLNIRDRNWLIQYPDVVGSTYGAGSYKASLIFPKPGILDFRFQNQVSWITDFKTRYPAFHIPLPGRIMDFRFQNQVSWISHSKIRYPGFKIPKSGFQINPISNFGFQIPKRNFNGSRYFLFITRDNRKSIFKTVSKLYLLIAALMNSSISSS